MTVFVGLLGAGAVLAGAPPQSSPHVVLDEEVVHRMLVEVARYHGESRERPASDPEALYRLGEKVQQLVELMNQDLASHGGADLLRQLLAKRLLTYQVRLSFSEREQRFSYDLAAFREYLSRAPTGKHAAEARFQIIARTFYQTVGSDPAKLVDTDVSGLGSAIAEEEQFLREYPRAPRAREVRFFLGVDYYRLHKNLKPSDTAARYRRLASQTLEEVVAHYPATIEARAAEALLEEVKRARAD